MLLKHSKRWMGVYFIMRCSGSRWKTAENVVTLMSVASNKFPIQHLGIGFWNSGSLTQWLVAHQKCKSCPPMLRRKDKKAPPAQNHAGWKYWHDFHETISIDSWSRKPRLRPWGSVALTTWHPLSAKSSPTGCSRSVGIVRLRTKTTELS
jgi:hypothetical protein